jgi:hypothetical protein
MKKKQQATLRLHKVVPTKKKTPARVVAARKAIRSKRPIHKRIALQPITVLLLLCVGVLLCALTIRALAADTVTTTAVVPAPPLTQPADITNPTDGYQTTTQAITVSGTCPNNSYVNLSDNNIFTGTDTCASGTFQISLDLLSGSNQLQVQDYNITNTAGPASSPIVVIYTPPTPPSGGGTSSTSPLATPTGLQILQLDVTVPNTSSGQMPTVSDQPTFAGIAPPGSYVSVSMSPGPYICTAYANAQGYWNCTMPTTLPVGIYTVDVHAKTLQGNTLTLPTFKVRVTATTPTQVGLPPLFHITSSYLYSEEAVGQPVSYTIDITGGRAPYAFTIDWGDGATATIVRQSEDSFTISHTYDWVNAAFKARIIRIQAIDTTGQSSTLQLETTVRNPAFIGAAGSATKQSGIGSFFNAIRPWLWLMWPGYGITGLLVFSFWLGEHQELALMIHSKGPASKAKRAHAHGHR